MTDQPQGVNINFSSFAKKDGYKPPNATQLMQKKDQKRQKFAPGGDWGDDAEETPAPQPTTNAPAIRQGKIKTPEPIDDFLDVQPKEETTTSKFSFIKKPNKTEKTSTMGQTDTDSVLLDFDTIRSEKQ